MNTENPNNEYKITYSNSFEFEGILLAFRKKELFDISKLPIHIPFNKIANCWLIKRKQLTLSKSQYLITNKQITVDVTNLQWFKQIELDAVFNL